MTHETFTFGHHPFHFPSKSQMQLCVLSPAVTTSKGCVVNMKSLHIFKLKVVEKSWRKPEQCYRQKFQLSEKFIRGWWCQKPFM